MRQINDLDECYEFCKALSSPLRVQIIKVLTTNRSANLNELADILGVTNGALTSHIKALHEAGLIDIQNTPGKRGLQKTCNLREGKVLIDFFSSYSRDNMYELSIPIGSYTRKLVQPTCGLATKTRLIGEVDNPRYFDDPQRTEAGILWLTQGFVEYRIPNYLKPSQILTELQVSLELSSEAPGVCEDWPSDIHFYMNDILLGYWTSPGDFGAVKGRYMPDWWFPNWNQYGLLKLLTINQDGSYIDGLKISDSSIGRLQLDNNSDFVLRIEVPEAASNVGGLTIFGKGFGNYNQDINVRVIYK